MKKNNQMKQRICPRCGGTYSDAPALSRADNKTFICPDCGTREALASMGVELSEQEKILESIVSVNPSTPTHPPFNGI